MNKEDILEIKSLMMYNKDLKMELDIWKQSVEKLEKENERLRKDLTMYKSNYEGLVNSIEHMMAGWNKR